MKKATMAGLVFLLNLLAVPLFAQSFNDVFGLWKTIDDETGKAKSVILVYKYQDTLYGRIVMTLDDNELPKDTWDKPTERAEEMQDKPFYSGLDMIWDMEPRGDKWAKGKICDPAKGKVYGCEINYDDAKGELLVRGKIGPFGRNQFWQKVQPADLPAGFTIPENPVPSIPRT